MTHINLAELTELQHINKKLVSGYHISEQDVQLWQQLDHCHEQYTELFQSLGHHLIKDGRGFYYLEIEDSTPNMGKISRAFALTTYVLVEYFANLGKDPLRALFEQVCDLELMQILVQQNKHLYDQLEIFSGSDLRKDVFMRMSRFGLAKEVEQGFIIQSPIYRYLDALMQINELDLQEDN